MPPPIASFTQDPTIAIPSPDASGEVAGFPASKEEVTGCHESAQRHESRLPGRPARALLCGLSTRAISLFLEPLFSGEGGEALEIVGVVEPDEARVTAFAERYGKRLHRFSPEDGALALRETRPDLLLVAVPDDLHERYILMGLEAGLEVVTEKPMVISAGEAARVIAAERGSRGRVRVAFNYRYSPLHARLKAFFEEGRLGRVIQVDFHYTLDTLHGASYFYRWNRERRRSGSLAVHKCCHSFDLLRWWIGQEPVEVTALGGLDYYGPQSPHRPGGSLGNRSCPYMERWFSGGGEVPEEDHPIYHLQGEKGLPFPHQYPDRLSLYDEGIDVEDNYSALIRFDRGARVTFSVNFSAPWEGYRMAVNGERGRLEVDWYTSAARCPFPAVSRATFLPLFGGEPEALEWETVGGGHGGADPRMLRDLFDRERAARLPTSFDGAMAVATGEAVWRSAVEGRTIRLHELPGAGEFLAPPPIRRGRGGFSTMEMLLTMVIVGVLAILASSVFSDVQRRARAVSCLTQLRALWSGGMYFVQDYGGRFSSINVERSRRDPKSPGYREYLGYTANLFQNTFYSCPEAQRGELAAGGNMFRSYGVNRLIVSNWAPKDSGATVVNGALERFNNVPFPHETFYLADGVPNPGGVTSSGKGINYYTNINRSNCTSLVELHGGTLNAIYLDGRAVALRVRDFEKPSGDVLWGGSERLAHPNP